MYFLLRARVCHAWPRRARRTRHAWSRAGRAVPCLSLVYKLVMLRAIPPRRVAQTSCRADHEHSDYGPYGPT